MCLYCAGEYPTEEVPQDDVQRIVALIEQLYVSEGCEVGGPLHVALDDWNIEDRFWEPYWEGDFPETAYRLSETICTEMLALSIGQRNYVMKEWECA